LNNRQFFLNHNKVDVYFKQSKDDFVVDEIPLYEFSGDGEHMILHIRKKDLTTLDMIQIFSNHIGCKSRDIGYAGLKDKNALTTQYISINKKFKEKIDSFYHHKIKILNQTYHNNKIRVGHLKGNKFFIRLKRVLPKDKVMLESVLEKISTFGMPNYFGFQRFGIEGDNYLKGKQISQGILKEKNKKLKQIYLNAYQSYLFNNWLSNRVKISKIIDSFTPDEVVSLIGIKLDTIKELKKQSHPFKIFYGDIMSHYPFGKIFYAKDLKSEADKFMLRDRVPTGLLAGKKVAEEVCSFGYPNVWGPCA